MKQFFKKNKKVVIGLFLGLVFVQIVFVSSIIVSNEKTIRSGNLYKFRLAPVDPNDPIRGKYMALSFRDDNITIENDHSVAIIRSMKKGDKLFISIKNDEFGFATIEDISFNKPYHTEIYFEDNIDQINPKPDELYVSFDYSFNKFFMNEDNIREAEIIVRKALRNNSQAYGLVYIYEGKVVLKDLCIDGVSIKEFVK